MIQGNQIIFCFCGSKASILYAFDRLKYCMICNNMHASSNEKKGDCIKTPLSCPLYTKKNVMMMKTAIIVSGGKTAVVEAKKSADVVYRARCYDLCVLKISFVILM